LQRDDISPVLVHLIRGDILEDAFAILTSIAREAQLRGGNGKVKGKYRCVCFSEAPLATLGQFLARPGVHGVKYKPFGVVVSKAWLFEQGGRPVIYQSDAEYQALPEGLRWRHVRYEPHSLENVVDFTWEREWRIKVDYLRIDPSVAQLLVPDTAWAERFWHENTFEEINDTLASTYASLTGVPEQAWVERVIHECPWSTVAINDQVVDQQRELRE
jgi:hypothetical protein